MLTQIKSFPKRSEHVEITQVDHFTLFERVIEFLFCGVVARGTKQTPGVIGGGVEWRTDVVLLLCVDVFVDVDVGLS